MPICRDLIGSGADAGLDNHRGAQPLHYAADGIPGSHAWNPAAQGATVTLLMEAGADPTGTDKGASHGRDGGDLRAVPGDTDARRRSAGTTGGFQHLSVMKVKTSSAGAVHSNLPCASSM